MESRINDILNAKIVFDDKCSNLDCRNEIQLLEDDIRQLKAKLKETKEKYHTSLVENLKKDVEINYLSEKVKNLTDELGIYFNSKFQDEMFSLSSSERDDSTFVLMAIRHLFRDKIGSLSNYSMSGRSKSGAKNIFPEEDALIVRKVFEKRMALLAEKGVNILDRQKPANINRLIKEAIRVR